MQNMLNAVMPRIPIETSTSSNVNPGSLTEVNFLRELIIANMGNPYSYCIRILPVLASTDTVFVFAVTVSLIVIEGTGLFADPSPRKTIT
jgi:hypothetical protein